MSGCLRILDRIEIRALQLLEGVVMDKLFKNQLMR
jgi:hypothetical protein